MNELEAKCYLTKKGGANNSDHTCILSKMQLSVYLYTDNRNFRYYYTREQICFWSSKPRWKVFLRSRILKYQYLKVIINELDLRFSLAKYFSCWFSWMKTPLLTRVKTPKSLQVRLKVLLKKSSLAIFQKIKMILATQE